MKKILYILLCTLLCLSALCACSSNKTDTSEDPSEANIETPSVDISYNEVSYIIPGGNDSSVAENNSSTSSESSATSSDEQPSGSISSEQSELCSESSTEGPNLGEQQTGGFAVKMAKYDYNNRIEKENSLTHYTEQPKDVSIAILSITNETDQNYSVTINGKYLDKNGNVLKTETQEWDQFKAGWQKYFLFRPEISFDRFTYTIETKEYHGECWKTGVRMQFSGLCVNNMCIHPSEIESPDIPPRVEGLRAKVIDEFDVPFLVFYGRISLVLFDEAGQVIGIFTRGEGKSEKQAPEEGELLTVYYADTDTRKLGEWPKQFRGNVTGIYIIPWISDKMPDDT